MNSDEIYDWCELHGEDPFRLQYEWEHEDEPFGNKLYVYFSDEALDEIAYVSGKKVVKDDSR